jgi:hypothetical protein
MFPLTVVLLLSAVAIILSTVGHIRIVSYEHLSNVAPGRFKRAGVSCKGSVSDLRKKTNNSPARGFFI